MADTGDDRFAKSCRHQSDWYSVHNSSIFKKEGKKKIVYLTVLHVMVEKILVYFVWRYGE